MTEGLWVPCPYSLAPDHGGETHPHDLGYTFALQYGACVICDRPVTPETIRLMLARPETHEVGP